MPRRPSKKSRTKSQGAAKPRGAKRGEASIKRWERAEDIPMDEEDQFHASKDRILLEGEEEYDDDDDDDEDEVFALEGMDDASEDEDEGEFDEDEDMEDDSAPTPSSSKSAKKKGKKGKKKPTEDEDDEEELEESWGRKKSAYYASNADLIESDDEEANEMEEQEARRLQRKARDALADGDFGLGDLAAIADAREGDALEDVLEPAAAAPLALPQDKAALLRHLERTSPETLALARDWDDIAWSVAKAQEKLDRIAKSPVADALSMGMVHLHHQTLLSYASTLAFYLYLRSNPKHAAKPEALRTHPVFARLLTLKQALATLEELDFALSDDEGEGDLDQSGASLGPGDGEDGSMEIEDLWQLARLKGLDQGELEDLLMDAEGVWGDADADDGVDEEEDQPAPPKKRAKVAKAKPRTDEPPTKEKKKRKAGPAAPVFDLIEPEYTPAAGSGPTQPAPVAGADAFGEQTALHAADAADKQTRRRSLQFYTARLDSAAARREGARRAAAGGDDDLPYKQRERRRAEPAAAGGGARGADLDGGEDEDTGAAGRKRAREDDGADDDDGGGGEGADGAGYYSLVRASKRAAKAARQAEYDAARAAERDAVAGDADGADDGPRGVSRAILKNRGLTPRRTKSVRNPRVKKRLRFDAAKKRLGSQRAVHKLGAVDAGRYEGERSGISRVVKSVRLS